MNKTILLLLCGLFSFPAFCQSDTIPSGNICIMRSTGFTGSAKKLNLFLDGKRVCKIPNNRYVMLNVESGGHSIAVQMNGKELWPATERTEVPVEAGATSYFSVAMSTGLVDMRLELNAVLEKNAEGRLKKLKQAACGSK